MHAVFLYRFLLLVSFLRPPRDLVVTAGPGNVPAEFGSLGATRVMMLGDNQFEGNIILVVGSIFFLLFL